MLCRDQSRLGRDALEVTLAVRELVQERGGRLFFYADGQEVPYAKAIDAAMTFVRGVGHQMELEAIRSRVRERCARECAPVASPAAAASATHYSAKPIRPVARTRSRSSIPSRPRSSVASSCCTFLASV